MGSPATSKGGQARGGPVKEPETLTVDRWIKLGVIGAGAVLLLGALAMGGLVTKIFVAVVVLSVFQGLWRGAVEAAGVLVGTLLAVAIAPLLGKGLEGVVGGIFGTGGMLNRMISVGLVGIAITVVVAFAWNAGAKRVMAKRPGWKRWNPYVGAALGLIEGSILGMALMWAPLALEPIAAGQLAEPGVNEEGTPLPPNPAARGLVRFADEVRASSLGGLAETTNPIEGSRLLKIMQDFAAISKDPAAVRAFVDSEAMKRIAALPSIQRAREMIEKDPQLGSIAKGEGVSVSSLRLIAESDTILKIFDETGVVKDVLPLARDLEEAIAEARKRVKSR